MKKKWKQKGKRDSRERKIWSAEAYSIAQTIASLRPWDRRGNVMIWERVGCSIRKGACFFTVEQYSQLKGGDPASLRTIISTTQKEEGIWELIGGEDV